MLACSGMWALAAAGAGVAADCSYFFSFPFINQVGRVVLHCLTGLLQLLLQRSGNLCFEFGGGSVGSMFTSSCCKWLLQSPEQNWKKTAEPEAETDTPPVFPNMFQHAVPALWTDNGLLSGLGSMFPQAPNVGVQNTEGNGLWGIRMQRKRTQQCPPSMKR